MLFRKKKLTRNKELSRIFGQMADCYRFLGPDERFRANAYFNASRTLSNLSEPVENIAPDIKKLSDLKGIGESIAEKIVEYLDSGKIKTFETLKAKVPFNLLELLEVEGIGPSTLRFIYSELKLGSRDELIHALEQEPPGKFRGVSPKKIENLRKILKVESAKKRFPLNKALKTGNELTTRIKKIPGVHHCILAGSIRRKKETIGDIDIVITADERKWKRIIREITGFPSVKKVLAAGKTKASLILKNNIQVDVRIVHDEEYGAALLYFTGSREHTIRLRTLAKKRGWKLNEYGVFEEKSGKRLAGETEEEIYALFGMKWLAPEERTG